MIGGISKTINGLFTVREALGIREVLSWVKQKQWSHVVVEMDALQVYLALTNHQQDLSLFGLIISDCIQLQAEIPNMQFSFARRTTNVVAHSLARATISWAVAMGWDSTPPFLLNVINSDAY